MFKRNGIPTLFTRGIFPRLPRPHISNIRTADARRPFETSEDIRSREWLDGRGEMDADDGWTSMEFKRGPVDEQ